MSFKTLLTHVEPDWGSSRALDVAVSLCGLFQAHLVGVGAEAFDPTGYAYVDGGLVQVLRDQIDADLTSAHARFQSAAGKASAGSTWLGEVQAPAAAVALWAAGADLVVARRLAPGDGASNLCHAADLVTACGAPVLVAPQGETAFSGERILVAWRDCREARRALADSLPFLQRAEAVALVQVATAAEADATAGPLKAVLQRLERHGVSVKAQTVAPSHAGVGGDLERAAEQMGADLIVTGAYSHMRLRETILGGVTSDLLAACSKYVLFTH
jgi:nucleotide-binding universal stress UspA family protein